MASILRKALLSGTFFAVGFATFARPWKEDSKEANTRTLEEQRKEILHDIQSSENYKRLINDSDYVHGAHSSRVPKPYRHNFVSQGLFFGPQHLEIDPLVFMNSKENELQAYYHIGEKLCSYDGKIHSGVLSTVIDESLTSCGFPLLPSKRGVTAKLSINFKDHIKPDSTVILKAKVREHKGRKVIIDGHVETVGPNPIRIAEAECILVEPKWFKYFSWLNLF
jgi:hypothetical protein